MRLATIISILVILASSTSAYANDCHFLDLYAFIKDYRIGDVFCSKGKLMGKATNDLFVQQIGGEGPSCDVTFIQNSAAPFGNNWVEVSKIHIQQNLCALKAGNIHVSHLSGKVPTYTTKEGSFSHSRSGNITITGFK
jgi:hypothetical protein